MTAPPGAQGFPGFAPEAENDVSRDNKNAYVELAWEPTEKLLLAGALRYECFRYMINRRKMQSTTSTAMHHMLKAAVGGVQAPPDSVERWKKMLQYVKELDSAGSARQQRILQQLQKLVDTQQGSFYSKSKSAKI